MNEFLTAAFLIPLFAAGVNVALGYVFTVDLLCHVVDFQCKDRKPVNSPSRAFGIDRGIGLYGDILIKVQKIAVDIFDHIGAFLIRPVDTSFDLQGNDRIDFGIADDVFQMPLYRVDPVFQVQQIFDRTVFIRVIDRCIHMVCPMIIGNNLRKYSIALSRKHSHTIKVYVQS